VNVTFQDILQAYKRLKGRVLKTPLIHSETLTQEANIEVWFKMESLQTTGSFKVRGALNKLDSLTNEELKKGVITASTGNHAKGLSYASLLKNISAKIVVPENTPETKKQGIKRLGAELVVFGSSFDEAEWYANQLAEQSGSIYVNSFDDHAVVAGQGTSALEAFLAEPDFDAVVVPAGGGGLLCGVALVAKTINPAIKVIGVQSHASPPWYYSFKEGELVTVEYKDSYAEGLYGGINQSNLDLLLQIVDDFVLVEEESIAESVHWMAKEHHYMIEGAAAAGITALRDNLLEGLKGKKVLTLITGSNIEIDRLVQFTQYNR
jgi:threonine dehydratase